MPRTRRQRALVNFVTREQILEALAISNSRDGLIKNLGFVPTGNTRDKLFKRCKELNIVVPDFPHGNKGRKFGFKRPLEYYTRQDSNSFDRKYIIRQLVERGIKPAKCETCGQGQVWNNKPLVLQLHHKNGVNNDNRLENLQILCPNCHSQTKNYAGRNNLS